MINANHFLGKTLMADSIVLLLLFLIGLVVVYGRYKSSSQDADSLILIGGVKSIEVVSEEKKTYKRLTVILNSAQYPELLNKEVHTKVETEGEISVGDAVFVSYLDRANLPPIVIYKGKA